MNEILGKNNTSINRNLKIEKVRELFARKFFISNYQRGYRWNRENVEYLLEDLKEFKESNSKLTDISNLEDTILDIRNLDKNEEFYCFQPLIVRPMTNSDKTINNLVELSGENEEIFEVIDGQQRLTTIYILLKYLFEKLNLSIEMYEIFYQTRGNNYLKKITKEDIEKDIDNFYIYEAKQEIIEWFENNVYSLRFYYEILYILLYCSKFIWYEVDSSENSVDVFTRINTGKIALTNAELIKALLLKDNLGDDKDVLYLKQLEIANDWDLIESKLHDDNFWYFFNNPMSKKYTTKIEYLFEIGINDKYKVKDDNSYDVFNYFYQESKKNSSIKFIEEIWNQSVRKNFMILKQWYEDKDLYHLIGYLIAVDTKKDSRIIVKKLIKTSKTMSKKEFKNELIRQVKLQIEYEDKEDKSLTKLYITKKYKKISYFKEESDDKTYNKFLLKKILLAFNIITYMNSNNRDIRFPFFRYKINSSKNGNIQGWDIEHIHPQTSEVPEKDDEIDNYFKIMQKYFEKVNSEEEIKFFEILKNQQYNFEHKKVLFDKAKFQELYQKINDLYGDQMVNSDIELGNMVLLSAEMNRSYKNAPFSVKREKIIEWDKEGEFIPICTKNAFLKYYSNDMDNKIRFWKIEDINAYFEKMISTIIEFFYK